MDKDVVLVTATEITDLLIDRLQGQEFRTVFAVLHTVLEYMFTVAGEQVSPISEEQYRRKFIEGLSQKVHIPNA